MNDENMVRLDFGDKACQIFAYESPLSPDMSPQYEKVELSALSKGQISALYQQLPSMVAASTLKDAYYVAKWPDGVPHKLVKFADNSGYMSTVRGEGGKFAGHAHFQPLSAQAVVMMGFAVMSVVTSQYFLTEINRKMTRITQSIDQILAFLYGDKKAELLSEISFAKYAYENFASIMAHSEQRAATIQSIQGARKTAIQDVEFYLNDLHTAVQGAKTGDMEKTVDKAFQIRQCLDLSIQLYMTANLLEVYYSQNYDPAYLAYVENDVRSYLGKYEKQLIADFNALKMAISAFKPKIGQKVDTEALTRNVSKAISYLMDNECGELEEKFISSLYSAEKAVEYCIAPDGTIYLKKAA